MGTVGLATILLCLPLQYSAALPQAAVHPASAEMLSIWHGIQRYGRYHTSKFHSSYFVLRLMVPLSSKQDLDYSQSLYFLLRLFPLPKNFNLHPLSNHTSNCNSSNVPGLLFRCTVSKWKHLQKSEAEEKKRTVILWQFRTESQKHYSFIYLKR